MFRLSKLTDYAVVLLAQMARGNAKVATTSTLSEITGLPQPTVSKVLKLLAKDGLLKAHRGATGGYALSREAAAITIADIIIAMDGPIAVTDCAEGSHQSCQMEKLCPINGHWNRVNTAIRGALQNVTLSEMANDVPDFLKIPAGDHKRAASGKV